VATMAAARAAAAVAAKVEATARAAAVTAAAATMAEAKAAAAVAARAEATAPAAAVTAAAATMAEAKAAAAAAAKVAIMAAARAEAAAAARVATMAAAVAATRAVATAKANKPATLLENPLEQSAKQAQPGLFLRQRQIFRDRPHYPRESWRGNRNIPLTILCARPPARRRLAHQLLGATARGDRRTADRRFVNVGQCNCERGVTAMKFNNQLALILGALALSLATLSVSAQAKARQCVSAECACERALARNTVAALEDYLKTYQDDASSRDTACAALSLPAEDENAAEDRKAEYDSSLARPDLSTDLFTE
jgi:hypothetical protein